MADTESDLWLSAFPGIPIGHVKVAIVYRHEDGEVRRYGFSSEGVSEEDFLQIRRQVMGEGTR